MKHRVIEIAERYLGVPFIWHTHDYHEQYSDRGFDCSGFVRAVLRKAGFPPPTAIHARELFDHYGQFIQEGDAEPSDLVFFTKYSIMPCHVAFVADDDRVIHTSSRTGKVAYSSMDELLTTTFSPVIDTSIAVKYPRRYFLNPVGYKTH